MKQAGTSIKPRLNTSQGIQSPVLVVVSGARIRRTVQRHHPSK
jgi:hypothetical protein